MKRIISCIMAVVLVVGLMPLPAFAQAPIVAGSLAAQDVGDSAYDVSGGKYAPYESDTVRKLYTRTVVIRPGTDEALGGLC